MNSRALTVYDLIKPSTLAREIPLLLAFNLLLVGCSYLAFSVPFSPVPITGQTFGVLLIGMALGRTRGAAVVLAYLMEGIAGLPVFAGGNAGPAALMGPTGGYLVGFLLAAWLVGWMADKGWDRSYVHSVLAMTIGTAVVLVSGLAQLSFFVPGAALFQAGLGPFLPGAGVKIAAAAVLLPTVWKFVGRRNQD